MICSSEPTTPKAGTGHILIRHSFQLIRGATMIFETGNSINRRCRRAFTLVELILVLALLFIAVSLVAPRMSTFVRGRALDAEARRLLAMTNAGKARAVSEGMPMV